MTLGVDDGIGISGQGTGGGGTQGDVGNYLDEQGIFSTDEFLRAGFGYAPQAVGQTFNAMTPEQIALLNQFSTFMSGQLGNIGELTSLTSLEQQALGGIEGQVGEFTRSGEEGRSAILDVLANTGANFEDFFQTNIRDPLLEDFEENIRPETSRKFASSGFFSSQREQADEADMESLLQALTQGKSSTQLGAQQLNLQAATAIPGFEQGIQNLFQGALEAGGTERDIFSKMLALFAQSIGVSLGAEPFENALVGLPGQQGGIQSFLGGFGSGLGSSMGS